MPLTPCRQCGTPISPHAQACPACGATVAPAPPAAYQPAPRRPPEPERPWWKTGSGWGTAAGWLVLLAVCGVIALVAFRASSAADRRKTEQAEVAREKEYLLTAHAYMHDTSASAPVPDSAGRPVPTSQRARRMWVVTRMLVERSAWQREVMRRHGVGLFPPPSWDTPRYRANARAYPQVGRFLEGRAVAMGEMEKTYAAWMDARIAAVARESGMPADEIRGIFPAGFAPPAPGETRAAEAMLELHRDLVRMDPRVRPAGGNMLSYEREADLRRVQELEGRLKDALDAAIQGRHAKAAEEGAVLARVYNG